MNGTHLAEDVAVLNISWIFGGLEASRFICKESNLVKT